MNNPLCYYGGSLFSQLEIAGRNDQRIFPLALHHTCAVGRCNFFRYVTNDQRAVYVYSVSIHEATYMASIDL